MDLQGLLMIRIQDEVDYKVVDISSLSSKEKKLREAKRLQFFSRANCPYVVWCILLWKMKKCLPPVWNTRLHMGKRLSLVSCHALKPAIHIYKKFGFGKCCLIKNSGVLKRQILKWNI